MISPSQVDSPVGARLAALATPPRKIDGALAAAAEPLLDASDPGVAEARTEAQEQAGGRASAGWWCWSLWSAWLCSAIALALLALLASTVLAPDALGGDAVALLLLWATGARPSHHRDALTVTAHDCLRPVCPLLTTA